MKEGDKVISWVHGVRTAMSVLDGGEYIVKGNNRRIELLSSGKEFEADLFPLFYPAEEFKQRWPADYARMTQPDIKPGTPIFVWYVPGDVCIRRFVRFTNNGAAITYDGTANKTEYTWDNWSLTDPLEEV
jgi:hypothetical protein